MPTKRKRHIPKIEVVDLFCGAGGLSYGLKKEGLTVRAGIDLDESCRWPFEKNVRAKFLSQDVAHLTIGTVSKFYRRGSTRVLVGCAPCQKFSSYTQRAAKSDVNRWRLLDSFGSIASKLSPDIISMENVPGLARHRRFEKFVAGLVGSGYAVWYDTIECSDYGMPQHRKRLVLLASRIGKLKLVTPAAFGARPQTVKDVISGLPRLRAGSEDKSDPVHRSSALSAINRRRIEASRPGGTWRDWPADLVLRCHKKPTGKGYPSIYGRMSWDRPAPTITTLAYNYGSGRFGHPSQNRAISLREAALLQTFPRNYAFARSNTSINVRDIGRLIGNAVPVTLGQVIGRSIVEHLSENRTKKRR